MKKGGGGIGCSESGLVAVRTESYRGSPVLVEDQTLEVVSEIDQPDLGVGTRQAGLRALDHAICRGIVRPGSFW